MYRGIITGLNEAFVIDNKVKTQIINEDPKYSELIKPFLIGKDVKRYQTLKSDTSLILMPKGWTNIHSGNAKNKWKWLKENYPTIANHLEPFSELAEKRFDKGDYWWELRSCEYYGEFEKQKIFYPDIAPRGYFTLDEAGNHYCANSCYFIANNQKYLLGLLNSKLITYYYSKSAALIRGGYLRFFTQDIEKLPIYIPDFDTLVDKARHDKMVALVTQMLDLNKKLQDARLDQEKTQFQRQIVATDAAIDALVYELYGLTAEEIKIVEGK